MPERTLAPLSQATLQQRTLDLPDEALPVIVVRSPTWHPYLYRKRLGTFDPRAKHGDMVRIVLESGETFGYGLFNPRSEITVRLLSRHAEPPAADWWDQRLAAAVSLRNNFLRLPRDTDACRLIHAEADGLPGLIVDRYDDVLSVEVFSLGMYQRIDAIAERLAALAGTRHLVIRCGPQTLEQEGFAFDPYVSPDFPTKIIVQEFGTRFQVDFLAGHKTGFFCDQRENRRRLAGFVAGKSLLDLCCYTGGFSVQAKVLGEAADVTGVDLDEDALALAKRNANLNQQRVRFVHADAFNYIRDMLNTERRFDVVVLDPPKLIASRDDVETGRKKYLDFNRLASQLVQPGGLLLTCSCSGLMDGADFTKTVSAAIPSGRRAQILAKTGAAADHPVATSCPETEYLKALWLRLD